MPLTSPSVVVTDINGNPVVVAQEELTRIRQLLEDSAMAAVEKPAQELPIGSFDRTRSLSVAIAKDQVVPVSFDNYNAVPSAAYAIVKSALQTYGAGVAGTAQSIRATAYTEPTAAAQRSLTSSSANDTSAGTGAQQVTITYLDAKFKRRTDVVSLAGAGTAVTNAQDIFYVESIQVTRVGSGLRNAGTITLFVNAAAGGGTIGTIGVGSFIAAVGDNETKWGHHYVPFGKTARITNQVLGTSGSANNGYMLLRAKKLDPPNSPELDIGSIVLVSVPFTIVNMSSSPILVPGPAYVNMYCVPSANSIGVFASYDVVEL